jgi:ribosomal protein S18 acetylase RimI-like enzyme
MIDITELHALSQSQLADILALMKELDPEVDVTPGMIDSVLKAPGSHLFAALDACGADVAAKSPVNTTPGTTTSVTAPSPRILGVATLCVYESPTGRKASVEDVVVSQACRGQHIGKRLMEHIITFASTNLADLDLCLTSRPHRVAANNLYRSLGFQPKETNVYKMPIKR